MSPAEEIELLKAQLADRQELIGVLTREDRVENLCALGLSPAQARIAAILMGRPGRWVDRDTLWRLVCQRPDGDGPEIDTIRQHAFCLRQRLRRIGAPDRVEGRRGNGTGGGHRMTPELAAWLEARVG